VLLNEAEMEALYKTVSEGTKSAVHYIQETGSRYDGPYVILKEKIITNYYGFEMPVNSFMFKPYSDKVSQLKESGIIDWIHSKMRPKKPNIADNRVALSLDHLMVWFKLWFALLLVACVAFFAEIFVGKCKKVSKKSRNPQSS
jgi:hypothetical protein